MRSHRRILVFLIAVMVLQLRAVAREIEGTVPLIRGVRNRVYGTLRDSVVVVSDGHEARTLPVDHHGRFHVDLPEGTWRVIDVAPKDRKKVRVGQTFTVTPGKQILKIKLPIRLS